MKRDGVGPWRIRRDIGYLLGLRVLQTAAQRKAIMAKSADAVSKPVVPVLNAKPFQLGAVFLFSISPSGVCGFP